MVIAVIAIVVVVIVVVVVVVRRDIAIYVEAISYEAI